MRHYQITAIFLVACICGAPLHANLSKDECADIFHEANRLYRQANESVATAPDTARDLYKKAALRFEQVIREGNIHNGALHYNTGNAWFRHGDLGRAILHYRRALHYTPNDSNLLQNLQYARSRRLDKLDTAPEAKVLKTLLFFHYDTSLQTRAYLFLAAFLLAWLILSLRRMRPDALPRWSCIAFFCLAGIFLGSIIYEEWQTTRYPAGVVLSREVVARKGDGTSYQTAFREPLHTGLEFVLQEKRNGWLLIRLGDNRTCWIPADTAELLW